jgi:hypothetical protein
MSNTPLGTRTLKALIDGVVRTADVNKCEITSKAADSDFTSFADAAAGGSRVYTLKFTATQDPADVTSIWYVMWTKAGQDIPIEIWPYGGAVVGATNPKFTGTVTVVEPEGTILGGEADASTTARMTMDLEWKFLAKPVRVIA